MQEFLENSEARTLQELVALLEARLGAEAFKEWRKAARKAAKS